MVELQGQPSRRARRVYQKGASMNRVLIVSFLLVVLLAACAPDPRKEAEAFATRTEAEQSALNQEQAREQKAELHRIEMEKKQARLQELNDGFNRFIRVMFFCTIVFAVVFMFYSTRSAIESFNKVTVGLAEAAAHRAMVRANLIALDPQTRQFPILLQHVGKGVFSATNFNTNSTLLLDTRNEPDRQMISAMGAVQYAGALAQEAAKADDPTGVSIIQTPVINWIEDKRGVENG